MTQATPATSSLRQRRYPYLIAILRACFTADLWRDVRQNWRGIGVLYMFLLLAITWAIACITPLRSVNDFLEVDAPRFIRQVPPITIEDGVVYVDAPEPHVIKDPYTNATLAIIDTTGETTALPEDSPAFLLTENSLIVRQSAAETRTYDLSQVESFAIDQTRLNGWLGTVRRWYIPTIYVVLLTFSFIWRIILMLAGGGIGMLMARIMGLRLDYAAAVRLSAIAMTPGILLSTFLSLTNLRWPGFHTVLFGIALFVVYLALALRANRPAPPAIPPSAAATPN